MEQSTALATRDEVNAIANIDPSTAWLYTPSNRISIDNENRNGFVINGTDEKVAEIAALILGIKPLHSHKQPDEKKNEPRHLAQVEWCESYDNRTTNAQGNKCGDCPAFGNCKWKLELTINVAGRDGEYLLTVPTVSAMRYKELANALAKNHKRHYSQAVWKMTVHTEKSNGNIYPVIEFFPHDPQTGAHLNGQKPQATQPANGNGHAPTMDDLKAIRQQMKDAGLKTRTVIGDEINTPEGLAKVYDEHKKILAEHQAANI